MSGIVILEARHISLSFPGSRATGKEKCFSVIRDLSLAVREGEVTAVVGASGSGKSLLAHAIMGILPESAALGGEMFYRGEPLTQERIRALRGREIVLVPQSVSALDPLMKVGPQVRGGKNDAGSKAKSAAALARYGLGREIESLYPFELSGGMARRVLIASAAMRSPKLVIADEPTPGLHQAAAKRVMSHFREIADSGSAVLVVTHDLELAAETADRVAVFYAGTAVEEALASDFADVTRLRHPYTRALWHAMPAHGFAITPGMQPNAAARREGCLFAAGCAMAEAGCMAEIPYREKNGGFVRCVREGCGDA